MHRIQLCLLSSRNIYLSHCVTAAVTSQFNGMLCCTYVSGSLSRIGDTIITVKEAERPVSNMVRHLKVRNSGSVHIAKILTKFSVQVMVLDFLSYTFFRCFIYNSS